MGLVGLVGLEGRWAGGPGGGRRSRPVPKVFKLWENLGARTLHDGERHPRPHPHLPRGPRHRGRGAHRLLHPEAGHEVPIGQPRLRHGCDDLHRLRRPLLQRQGGDGGVEREPLLPRGDADGLPPRQGRPPRPHGRPGGPPLRPALPGRYHAHPGDRDP